MDRPTEEQITALRQFREREGRAWKAALLEAWRTGRYPYHCREHSNLLQQLRNQFGSYCFQFAKG